MWILDSLHVLDTKLVTADNNVLWVADILLCWNVKQFIHPLSASHRIMCQKYIDACKHDRKLMQVPPHQGSLVYNVCTFLACCRHYNFLTHTHTLHKYTQIQMNICHTPLTYSLPPNPHKECPSVRWMSERSLSFIYDRQSSFYPTHGNYFLLTWIICSWGILMLEQCKPELVIFTCEE